MNCTTASRLCYLHPAVGRPLLRELRARAAWYIRSAVVAFRADGSLRFTPAAPTLYVPGPTLDTLAARDAARRNLYAPIPLPPPTRPASARWLGLVVDMTWTVGSKRTRLRAQPDGWPAGCYGVLPSIVLLHDWGSAARGAPALTPRLELIWAISPGIPTPPP